ncbi:hypothetical protein [Herbidospora cretacea]|uniref:hypothetical protein n=1 Tax=Herbidospora cretacea TaxID=28444 RepID=UPI0004C2F031|nr:hypothetical protein [Herbidospora cretacea]
MSDRDVKQTKQPTERPRETDDAKSSERPSLSTAERSEPHRQDDRTTGSANERQQERPSLPSRADLETVHREREPSKESVSSADHQGAKHKDTGDTVRTSVDKDGNKHTITDHHDSKGDKTGSTDVWREKAKDGTYHDHTKETVGGKTVAHSETWHDRNGNTHVREDHFDKGAKDYSTEHWREKGKDGTQHDRTMVRDAQDHKLYGNDRWRDENGNDHSRIDNYDDKGHPAGSTDRWTQQGADGRTDSFSDHREANGERTLTHKWSDKDGPTEFTKHYDKGGKVTSQEMKWEETKSDGKTHLRSERWDDNGRTSTDISSSGGLKTTHIEQFDRYDHKLRTEDRQQVMKDGKVQEIVKIR